MKKSVGIAVGLVVAAGAVVTGGAWYTGTKLEPVLNTSISDANKELKALLPGTGITPSLELVSLERGFFSSTARYRLKVAGKLNGDEGTPVDGELLFVDHMEHGPFPLSRLVSLKWLPVMAKSNFELEKTPLVEKWFAATKGSSPLTGTTNLGYNQDVTGTLQFQPVEITEAEGTLKFSGMEFDVAVADDKKQVDVEGRMDSLVFTAPDKTHVEFSGLSLVNNSELGASGLYLGTSESSLKQIQVTLPEQQPLLIKDLLQKGHLSEGSAGIAGGFTYDVGSFNYAGKDIGSMKMAGSLKNLDIAAVKSLVDLYKELLGKLEAANYDAANPSFDLTPEQKTKLEADLGTLLAGKPVLALDNLAFKTANGESSFKLSLGLNKPTSFELPPQEMATQILASLDARLAVSKLMIKDVVLTKAVLDPSADPAAVAQEAEQMSEMAGMMAVSTQMATVEGNDIVSSVKYADGQVDFNGNKMPLEQFIGMMAAMAPGAAAGMPGADADAQYEGEEAESGITDESDESAETEEAE
ncbi:MAG: YdgA family protein [Pseudomonas sp.]|uniref:YdgA family protein n=1 Tax=Pseudomonas sp. TaxID=306 RepID=UPI00339122E3